MKVTNIMPCIKVVKENSFSGVDMYIEFGSKIRVIYDKDNKIAEGIVLDFELGKYEYEEDILHLLLDDNQVYKIEVGLIKDIDEL